MFLAVGKWYTYAQHFRLDFVKKYEHSSTFLQLKTTITYSRHQFSKQRKNMVLKLPFTLWYFCNVCRYFRFCDSRILQAFLFLHQSREMDIFLSLENFFGCLHTNYQCSNISAQPSTKFSVQQKIDESLIIFNIGKLQGNFQFFFDKKCFKNLINISLKHFWF